jgi:hypothetical protein
MQLTCPKMNCALESSVSVEVKSMNDVKQKINHICISMVVLACALIAIMLITVHFQRASDVPAPAGWVAVVGAAIVFG